MKNIYKVNNKGLQITNEDDNAIQKCAEEIAGKFFELTILYGMNTVNEAVKLIGEQFNNGTIGDKNEAN